MATIRAMMIAGAALVFLHSTVPVHAQTNQAPAGAPLQLVPGENQAKKAVGATTTKKTAKTAAKTTTKDTARKSTKTTAGNKTAGPAAKRIVQPAAKRTAKVASAKRPSQTAAVTQRRRPVQSRPAQRAIAAVLPEMQRQASAEPLAFAPANHDQAPRMTLSRGT